MFRPNAHHGWAGRLERVKIFHTIACWKMHFPIQIKIFSQSHEIIQLQNEKCFSSKKNLIQTIKVTWAKNLTVSCFLCWSTGLTKRKLPMQWICGCLCQRSTESKSAIIALTGRSVTYNSYHSSIVSASNHCTLLIIVHCRKKHFNLFSWVISCLN